MSYLSSTMHNSTSFNTIEDMGLSSSPSLADAIKQAYDYLSRSTQPIFFDPKPEIIRKTNAEGPVVYQQKVLLRYLQPPPVPEPGPLIIKEIRPPLPPPPRPLIIRQYGDPLPRLPPLVLRERPPVRPVPIPSQTVIRHLSPVTPPARSVVIERIPALPAKPRDIIIERWTPYPRSMSKRQTIVEKAPPAVPYPPPKKIIYLYDSPPTKIIRKIERLGVVRENPQSYTNRHGTTLLDSQLLVEHARAAGVTEDLSPPEPQRFSSSPNDSISITRLNKGKRSSIPFDMISTASSQGFLVSNLRDDRTDNSLDSFSSRKKLKRLQ